MAAHETRHAIGDASGGRSREVLPRPAYLTDEWLHAHGIRDIDGLLGALRPETVVMQPESLRAIKATRLSFARNLISRMARERWRIELRHMEMDRTGVGRFIYGIDANGHQLHFGMLAFAPREFEWPGRIADAGFDFLAGDRSALVIVATDPLYAGPKAGRSALAEAAGLPGLRDAKLGTVDPRERLRSAIDQDLETADANLHFFTGLLRRIRLPNTERSSNQAG